MQRGKVNICRIFREVWYVFASLYGKFYLHPYVVRCISYHQYSSEE